MTHLIFNLLILALSIVGLWLGAQWLVNSATRMARHLRVSELAIGLTIVALGTSLPELTVSIGSALNGQGDIAVGNVVGSNIFNLGIILGMVALVRSIVVAPAMVQRDGMVLLGAGMTLLFFLRDLTLARWEGFMLAALLVLYLSYLFYQREAPDGELADGPFQKHDLLRLVAGLAMVLAGGHFLVASASDLARAFGVSEWLIGVTIVAIGTSAPEFVTSLTAIFRGNYGLSAGNLIGSDLFNVLGILGLAALVRPLTISTTALHSLPLLVGMSLLLVLLMRSGWKLSRYEGAALVLVGVVRFAISMVP